MNQAPDSLSPRDHQRVAEFVGEVAGIQLPAQKRNLIETRLRKRQRELGMDSMSAYIDHAMATGSSEQIMLLDALTTNKTEFFREAKHYPVFEEYCKRLLNQQRSGPIAIWSAGCSSGEEPYTLAMLAAEVLGDRFHIMATDLSVTVLDLARRATYPHKAVDPVPMRLRQKYLLRSRDPARGEVRIIKPLRRMIRFESFNLVSGSFSQLPQFDVVFCRNVMIYFSNQIREQLIRRFTDKLNPGGLLFIGHSETLDAVRHGLVPIVPTVYQKVA